MTVSSGAVAGRCNYAKSHPCLLKLNSTTVDSQTVDMRQYCAYSQSMASHNPIGTNLGNSHHHRRSTPVMTSIPNVSSGTSATAVSNTPTSPGNTVSTTNVITSISQSAATENSMDKKEETTKPTEEDQRISDISARTEVPIRSVRD